MSFQIESLVQEIQKDYFSKINSHGYLQRYLDEDLPKMRDEIANEVIFRREVEQKIYDQFMEQINELKNAFEEERKEREAKEEELITILQKLSVKIKDSILKAKSDRYFFY